MENRAEKRDMFENALMVRMGVPVEELIKEKEITEEVYDRRKMGIVVGHFVRFLMLDPSVALAGLKKIGNPDVKLEIEDGAEYNRVFDDLSAAFMNAVKRELGSAKAPQEDTELGEAGEPNTKKALELARDAKKEVDFLVDRIAMVPTTTLSGVVDSFSYALEVLGKVPLGIIAKDVYSKIQKTVAVAVKLAEKERDSMTEDTKPGGIS